MARTKIDLNRFKKVYPLMRRSPFWYYKENGGLIIETHSDTATSGQLEFTTAETYNSPVAVASAEDNVNVWISLISPVGNGTFTIRAQCSDTSYSGVIHLHVGEGNG